MSETESAGGNALLGTNYGICTRPDKYRGKSTKSKRYSLQSAARWILSGDRRLLVCHRHMAPGEQWVTVKYSPTTNRAKYGNLMRCGNAWICPVCSGQITDTRKKELHVAVVAGMKLGLKPLMLTYTLRHNFGDRLADLLADLLAAYRAMTAHRPYQTLKKSYQFFGSIRALEITYLTGWHPHLHVMVFVPESVLDQSGLIETMEGEVFEIWLNELKKQGRDAQAGIGVDVRAGDDYIAEYIAKFGSMPKENRWTIEKEMTAAVSKKSRGGDGTTPFGLLEDYHLTGDYESASLFREFAGAVKGRSLLQWSRGLADSLGVDLVDDVAALDMSAPDFADVVRLSLDMWNEILKTGQRGAVLDVAEKSFGNVQAIIDYCQAVYNRLSDDDFEGEDDYHDGTEKTAK